VDNRCKLLEFNPEAGKLHRGICCELIRSRGIDAFVGAMVDLAVSVLDGMDGGGGVYPQSPDPDGIRFLLDLRGGAQR
jgi:hypothetical protein